MSLNFESIYIAHKDQVYNLALHYVQNMEDAQEVTQDVFVSIHQSLATFKGDAMLGTWIHRITINKSLDFIKAKKRKKRLGFISSLFSAETNHEIRELYHFDHPGVLLENKEGMEALFILINELPDNQKTALILSKIEDKTQAEIASIMQLSIKAVESLLQRAKQNLKNKMNENEG